MVKSKTLGLILLVMSAGAALAQQAEPPKPNPLDVIPEKMPFATPYGAPISLARAQAAISAAIGEAEKRGWAVNVAVVDSGAKSRRLRADGRRAAGFDRGRRTQGARGGELSTADESLRGRHPKVRQQICPDHRWGDRIARRHPVDRGRQADRRNRLLGRHGFSRRGSLHRRRGDGQQVARFRSDGSIVTASAAKQPRGCVKRPRVASSLRSSQ